MFDGVVCTYLPSFFFWFGCFRLGLDLAWHLGANYCLHLVIHKTHFCSHTNTISIAYSKTVENIFPLAYVVYALSLKAPSLFCSFPPIIYNWLTIPWASYSIPAHIANVFMPDLWLIF